MGVFYVDIYVYRDLKNFFSQKNRNFTEFFLTLPDFFYTIKMLFSKIGCLRLKLSYLNTRERI